jgi:hypothetical protein
MSSLAVRADSGQERLESIDDSPEIYRQPEVPVLVGDSLERTLNPNARIVNQHMEFAEHALGLFGGGRHRGAVGNVEPDCMHALEMAALAETGQCLVDVVLTQVGEYDLHSGCDERPGDAEPDATRSACDERRFSLDKLHTTAPSRRVNCVQDIRDPRDSHKRQFPAYASVAAKDSRLCTLRRAAGRVRAA